MKASEFKSVFDDAPIRAGNDQFLILSRPNGGKNPRLGLVIAKKHIRLAVGRNRIKRIARETFRQQQHTLPPIDAIVLARKGAANAAEKDLTNILTNLWKRIQKKSGVVTKANVVTNESSSVS